MPSFGHLSSAFFWPSPFDHLLATLFWLPSFGHLLSAIGHLFWAIFFWPSSVGILLAAFCPSSFGCFGRPSAFYCFLFATFFDHHLAIFSPSSFAYLLCLLLTCYHSCSFCFHLCCFCFHLCRICSAAQRTIQCPLLHLALTALMSKSLASFCILSDWLRHRKQCQQNKLECSHVWHRTGMFWHNSCPKS